MKKIISALRNKQNRISELNGTKRGYYLIYCDEHHFISKFVDANALQIVADNVMVDKNGWDYWINYSYDKNVNNSAAWCNIDYTDMFI